MITPKKCMILLFASLLVAACSQPAARRPLRSAVEKESLSDSFEELAAELVSQLEGYGEHWSLVVADVPSGAGEPVGERILSQLELAFSQVQRRQQSGAGKPFWSVHSRGHAEGLLEQHGHSWQALLDPARRQAAAQSIGVNALVAIQLSEFPARLQLVTMAIATKNGQVLATAAKDYSENSELAYLWQEQRRSGMPAGQPTRPGSVATVPSSSPSPKPPASKRSQRTSTSNVPLVGPGTRSPLLKVQTLSPYILLPADASPRTAFSFWVQKPIPADPAAENGHEAPAPAELSMPRPVLDAPDRRPIEFCLALDVSGSMAEVGRLRFAQQAATTILEQLQSEDKFSLVTFADDAEVLIPQSAVTAESRDRARRLIGDLTAAGMTNYEAALQTARQQFESSPRGSSEAGAPAPVQGYVIFISDGRPTEGLQSAAGLAGLVTPLRETGVLLETIGVGTYFRTDVLRCLAATGGGRSLVMTEADALTQLLPEMLSAVRQPLVENLKIEIRLEPGVRVIRKGSLLTATDSGRTLQQNAGLLREEEILAGAVELELPQGLRNATRVKLGEVLITYRELKSGLPFQESESLFVIATSEPSRYQGSENVAVLGEAIGLALHEVVKQAFELAEAGNVDAARQKLEESVLPYEDMLLEERDATVAAARVRLVREFAKRLGKEGFSESVRAALFHDLHCPHTLGCACKGVTGPACVCLSGAHQSSAP